MTRAPTSDAASACHSLGDMPYASRKVRLKWAGLLNPQRCATAATVILRFGVRLSSCRQESSLRRRTHWPTVVPSFWKSLCR